MFSIAMLCAILGMSNPQVTPPLSCAKRLVLPIYPKLAKIAHDARVVTARVKVTEDGLKVIEIKGGNKYYDEAIRTAVASWDISSNRPFVSNDFSIAFDFRLSEDVRMDGLYEVDIDGGKIVVWGLMRYTDTEQLPIATRYLPCRVDASTTLIFPSATKIANVVASSDAVQVAYKPGDSTMQVISKASGDGSRLTITTADGSTYYYDIHHEILNGNDGGAINYSVWPLNDEQIKKVFEAEILEAIRRAPAKRYKISYSSRKPKFSVQPTVGFDGKRTAFLVESPLNAAVLVYAGTKESHMPAQTVPLKFNSEIWISDRVSDHWFIRHEDEWVTIDVLP